MYTFQSYGTSILDHTVCCLPSDTNERAPPNPAREADTRLTYPEGW